MCRLEARTQEQFTNKRIIKMAQYLISTPKKQRHLVERKTNLLKIGTQKSKLASAQLFQQRKNKNKKWRQDQVLTG